MPKKVIVTTIWSCSLCSSDTDQDKITPFTLNGGGGRRSYDVCATCVQSEPFVTFLSAGLSDRASGKKKSDVDEEGKTPCPYCGKKFSETGMGMHQASAHNVKSKTQITMETRGKTGKFICSECGFRSVAAQGLAAHQKARHAEPAAKRSAISSGGHPCPDCPEFVAENAQGLGAHRRHFHPGEPKLGHGGGHKTRKAAAK